MKVAINREISEVRIEQWDGQNGEQNHKNDSEGEHELEYDYNLKVGQAAPSGGIINHIYAHEKDQYLIYSTDRSKHPIVIAEHENLLTDSPEICKELLQIRDYKENDPHLKGRYNQGYAQALRTILDNHPDAGLASLRTVREEMENFLRREATYWYLLGAAIATLLVLAVQPFYLFESAFEKRTQGVFYAVLFSTLGGFLSVAIGSDKINLEIQNSELKKCFYGALRIAIAMVSGVLVYYAILGGYALSMLKPAESPYASYFLCAAAGFLEKLVPNIMLKLGGPAPEKQSESKKEVKT